MAQPLETTAKEQVCTLVLPTLTVSALVVEVVVVEVGETGVSEGGVVVVVVLIRACLPMPEQVLFRRKSLRRVPVGNSKKKSGQHFGR